MRARGADRRLASGLSLSALGVLGLTAAIALAIALPGARGAVSPAGPSLSALWGGARDTLLTAAGAVLLGAPPALLAAVQLHELTPRVARARAQRLFEAFAAVPGVVFGHLGVTLLGPWLGGSRYATAVLALALMAVPTVLLLALDALGRIPDALREASLALGATPWQTAWRAVVPAARRGLLGAVLAGFARAAGETVAVAMIAAQGRPETLATRTLRGLGRETPWSDAPPTMSLLLLALTTAVVLATRRRGREVTTEAPRL